MKRLVAVAMMSLLPLTLASSAYADHDYGGGGYSSDEDCRNGGCGEREETYGDNSCKYVCPDFKDSPVQDAFNFGPQICLPGATCHFEDRNPDEQRQGEPQR